MCWCQYNGWFTLGHIFLEEALCVEDWTGSQPETVLSVFVLDLPNRCSYICSDLCGIWQQRWLFIKDTFMGYICPKHGLIKCVMLFDSGFEVSSSMYATGLSHGLQIATLSRYVCFSALASQSGWDYIWISTASKGQSSLWTAGANPQFFLYIDNAGMIGIESWVTMVTVLPWYWLWAVHSCPLSACFIWHDWLKWSDTFIYSKFLTYMGSSYRNPYIPPSPSPPRRYCNFVIISTGYIGKVIPVTGPEGP
jgi:hypothetical protein